MSYSQALEAQMSILESLMHRQPGTGSAVVADLPQGLTFDDLNAAIRSCLRKSEAFYWAPDMCEVIETTAQAMPEMTLREEDLPSPFGFCWFSRPLELPVPDRFPIAVPLLAFTWAKYGPNCLFSTFQPTTEYVGVSPCLTSLWSFGETSTHLVKRMTDQQYIPGNGAEVELYRRRSELQVQYIAAALAFMNQRIVTTPSERAVRATRKRAERMEMDEPLIRVVKLRRAANHAAHVSQTEPVEWSCSWVVSGHWRQQACGPNHSERRPVFVLPHVKGPADKPLKASAERVFAVVR